MRPRAATQLLSSDVLLLACGLTAVAALWIGTSPHALRVTMRGAQGQEAIDLPLHRASGGKRFDIQMTFDLSPLFPSVYRIVADDCIESIQINGKQAPPELAPFCSLDGRDARIGSLLRPGSNTIALTLRDDGGVLAFDFSPSYADPLRLTLLLLGLAVVAWYAWSSTRQLGDPWRVRLLLGIVLAGAILRIGYMAATPYATRSYDWDGHIEYIRYISDHLRMPPSQGGWEFYQPPLFYALSGLWMRAETMVGAPQSVILEDIRLQASLISIAALIAAAWIGWQFFPKKRQTAEFALFCLVFAAFPGIVFFASRISNDTLSVPISLCWFGTLLRWWLGGRDRDWYISCVLLAAALLTKSNALPFVPIAAASLLLHPDKTWRRRAILGGIGSGILAVLAGWFFVLRFVAQRETFIVGNHLNGGLGVRNTFTHLTAFNPQRIMAAPFNANWDDSMRRQYFWEYLFKSAFVGEWDFGERMRSMTLFLELLSFALFPLFLRGLIIECHQRLRATVPLLLTLVALPAAALLYRLESPFSANQDFRFIPLMLIPITYYLVACTRDLSSWPRRIALAMLALYAGACACFVLLLAYGT